MAEVLPPMRRALDPTPFLGSISTSPELRRHQTTLRIAGEEDYVFGNLAFEVGRRMELLNKPLRIRVAQWLEKLARARTSNRTWQRLRNEYARVLVAQLERGRVSEPFHSRPPDGPLPELPHWMRLAATAGGHPATLSESARQTASKRAAGGPFGSHMYTNAGSRPASAGAGVPGGGTDPGSGPLSSRAARRLFEEAAVLRGSSDGPSAGAGSLGPRSGSYHEGLSGGAQRVGSRVALSGFDASRLGPRSKAELESELGASRERNTELNWKLRVAEDRLRDASLHLSRTVGDAAARRVVGEVAAERASADGLERLLRKNEEKRDALRSTPESLRLSKLYGEQPLSAWAVSFGGASDATAVYDDDGWLRAMQEFRRQTELLRQQIALISP